MVLFLALMLCWLAVNGLWVWALVIATRAPDEAFREIGRRRGLTLFLVFITGWVGAIYFFIAIRPSLVDAERSLRTAAAPKQVAAATKYCLDCDLSSIDADATRCKNCGSERLASLADRNA